MASLVKKVLPWVTGNPALTRMSRSIVERATTSKVLSALPHDLLDFVYFRLRSNLLPRRDWRRNPIRTLELLQRNRDLLGGDIPLAGSTFLDLGCGKTNALSQCAIALCNGAADAIAIDLLDFDKPRIAAGLFEQLVEVLAHPDSWRFNPVETDAMLATVRRFDLRALRENDFEKGVAGQPVRLLSSPIEDVDIQSGTIGVCFSQAVFEHLLDFDGAVARLFELTKPGGVAVHHVDFRDHRAFVAPNKYHYWSFLSEPEDWTDNFVNRIRPGDMARRIERAGFEIVKAVPGREKMPVAFAKRLAPAYANLPSEELETTSATFVLRKPA